MSIPTIYIYGTKRRANERLAMGEDIVCENYSLFGGPDHATIRPYPDGTVVKFFTKTVGGSPYVVSYGNWRPARNKIA